MGKLVFTKEELALMSKNPLPWWSPQARWLLGRVAPGRPGVEYGDGGEPTGRMRMSHPNIDVWDGYVLDVLRAGWAYANAQPDGQALIEYQQSMDWAAWAQLEEQVLDGAVDPTEAHVRAKAYMLALGRSLGVPDPVEDDAPVLE